MTTSNRFRTISKEALFSLLHIASGVELSRPSVIIAETTPNPACQKNLEEKKSKHGKVEEIIDRYQSSTGRVTYEVRWQDGSQTQETVSSIRILAYDLYEAFEHRMLSMVPSDSNFSTPDESDDEHVIMQRLRKKNVKWADYEDPETDDKENQGPSKRRRTDNMTVEGFKISTGPWSQVPYYSDQEMIHGHWKTCSRCNQVGFPNGLQINKKKKKRLTKARKLEESFEMSSEEEQLLRGRLLLCITCSAATHEGCISDRTAKQYLRKCRQDDDELVMQFQCLMCLTATTEMPDPFPPCDRCHQVHTIESVKFMEQEKESEVPETVNRNVQQQDSRNLYRCQRCLRAYHEGCLSSVNNDGNIMNASNMDRERQRFEENWRCDDCIKYSKGVDIILTWRVIGESGDKEMEVDFDDVSPSKREYLIKWQDTGYTNLDWVSENWLKSIAKAKLKNFCDRQQHGEYMTVDKVVPKDYLTIERILTAEDSNGDIITTEDIHQVEKVFVKYHGLNYDHIYWDTPPPSDSHLYSSFRTAFHNYLLACEVDPPKDMGEQVELVRKLATQENYGKHELKQQPDFVRGGTLMPHQLDGLNWLIFQWEQEMGCVLADDMGLGKTIQIVTFLNFLLTKYRIYPFAIVVPLSTATNWLREFAKWAPEMVVVPYHGSSESRKRALKYEIFRGGSKKMRCHAIIFTYESATFDSQLIPKVDFWPVLVVDEAQRLKNDNSLLFQKLLHTIRFDHPILMTGTPLQNNIRELINIMHFVDRNKFANVRELEGKYSELSHTTVQNLHDQLKPYFLRRTKDVVLKTLPPKTEIIVPVSMSSLQKEVYKDLLEHNLKSYAQLTTVDQSRPNTVKKMSNILMQLRKTLGHPYLIQDIEIKQKDAATTHQVLIDACAKLKVLHQMLPKLKRDGHRVLIFSTLKGTLDILEDYLMYEQCKYVRIDGDTPSNERVANIDQFNAPNSDVFVFLLTTRAGGVGINLATADTVIMWDFDFNPHADLQAICRAYRIGQTRPVLILRFMTRLSVEEKIAQIAKKKMILDHLVVDKMDDDDLEEDDVESIIKFGAQALFERDDSKRITYDSAGIDKLLDRNTDVTREETIDQPEQSGMKHMSFSFAKVWNLDNDAATEDLSADEDKDKAEDDNFWEKFLALKKLQVEAAEQRKKEELGRGARKRTVVSYSDDLDKQKSRKKRKQKANKMDNTEEEDDADYQFEELPESEDEFEKDQDERQITNEVAAEVPLPSAAPTIVPPIASQQQSSTSDFQQQPPDTFTSILRLLPGFNANRKKQARRVSQPKQLQQSQSPEAQQPIRTSFLHNRPPHTQPQYSQFTFPQNERQQRSNTEHFSNFLIQFVEQNMSNNGRSPQPLQRHGCPTDPPPQPFQSQIRHTEVPPQPLQYPIHGIDSPPSVLMPRLPYSPDHDNYTIDHSNSRVSSQPVTQRSPFSQAPPLSAMSPPTLHNVGGNQQLHSGDTISSVAHNNQQQSQQLQWLPQYVPPPHQQVPRSPFPVQQQPVLVDQHGLHPNMTIQQNQPLTQNSSIPLHNQNQRMFFHAHSAPMQSFAQSTPTHEHIPSTSQPITQPTPHPRTPTLPHTLSTSQNEQFMPASPNQSQK